MYFLGKTDIGKQRQTNQDNFLTMRVCDNVTLFVLCDGMGGTNGGNIASSLAMRTFAEYIEQALVDSVNDDGICDVSGFNLPLLMNEAVGAANKAVYSRARENSELTNMGTTIVAALAADDEIHIANVGDSRMYLLEGKELTQLTHDHSYVQMLVDMGQLTKEEAATNPRRNILTRAVGTEPTVDADVITVDIPKEGSYFALCSDGLYNFLTEKEFIGIVRKKYKDYDDDDYDAELTLKTGLLVDTANANGGGDNITIILIKIV
ncbi:MAG: Stp1/IreP family PP2C-type Ser/Thr phosphatase [Clostridia bacterium]|nr:Stp1/IreP family PP2C-type Ser/Thr phosphatase [Clostridia bacterium]